MDSFRRLMEQLMPEGTSADVFRLNCAGQELTAREGEGNVIFEVSKADQCARREYDYDTAYKALTALRDDRAELFAWFPPEPSKKQVYGSMAGRIIGIVAGVILALGAGFCSFAVLMSSLAYGNQSPLENWAMQIFFVGILAAGIVLAWASAKRKVTVKRLFGVGGGYAMFVFLLSLILGIWTTRASDPVTPLVDYIVMTAVFGLFSAAGLALMIYTIRTDDGAPGGANKYYRQPYIRVQPSAQAIAPVVAAIRERTACDAISITLDFDRQPTLLDSKLGGLPYWDTSIAYPCDAETGEKLALLAQINLSQLPENNMLPRAGMLQFFIRPDIEYGMSSTKRVIYHKTVNRSVYEKEIKVLGIPGSDAAEYGDFPVTGEIAMDFKTTTAYMTDSDGRFEPLFNQMAEEMGVELFDGASYETMTAAADGDYFEQSTGHRIGGYPYFTQFDPRGGEYLEKYDFLLLQIDTDDKVDRRDKGVMWGDAGVGQFFINREALSRMELDDVFYTWDCC